MNNRINGVSFMRFLADQLHFVTVVEALWDYR